MPWTDADPPPRPDLYVVARFLDALHAGPVPRTKLQAMVRLNYDLHRAYLSLLARKGFVAIHPDKDETEHVSLTSEGRAAHARLVGWIRDAFGEIRF